MERSIYSAFGLDINDAYLKVAWIDGNGHLRSYNSMQLKPDVIQHGTVVDPERFKESVRKVTAEAKGDRIPTRWCVASIPDIHMFMKVIDIPEGVKGRHVRDFIFQNYHEELPMGIDELYLSWERLSFSNDGGRSHSVVFGYKKVIDEYVGLLHDSGLRVAGIQPDSVAAVNAIVKGGLWEEESGGKRPDDGAIIVNFRPGYASTVFYDRGQVALISTLRMTALSSDRLIERIKARMEVGRRWYRQLSGHDLRTVVTIGYGELMLKLQGHLASDADYDVTSGNYYSNLVPSVTEHGETVHLPSAYATAIGLAENIF